MVGDQHRTAGIDLRRPFAFVFLAAPGAQGRDRFFQHGLVKLDADILDMAGLFFAKQITAATQVQVMGGQGETGSQGIQRLHDLQALFRTVRDRLPHGRGEIGICACLRTTDPATQLIQLGQAETIGTVHDERVRGGDVDPGLNDGSRQEHIISTFIECRHDVFEL